MDTRAAGHIAYNDSLFYVGLWWTLDSVHAIPPWILIKVTYIRDAQLLDLSNTVDDCTAPVMIRVRERKRELVPAAYRTVEDLVLPVLTRASNDIQRLR